MPILTGIGREQITFSNLESQMAPDNEIRFINALVEEYISPDRSAKECDLLCEVKILSVVELNSFVYS